MIINDTIKAKQTKSVFYSFPISGNFASASEIEAYITSQLIPENVVKEEINEQTAVLEKPNANALDYARAVGLQCEDEIKQKLEAALRGLPVTERKRILEAMRG